MSSHQESLPTECLMERRFVSYINVCLRRYAARWKRTLRASARREAPTLNKSAFDEDGDPIEQAERLASAVSAPEDDYLGNAPLSEVIADYRLYRAIQELTPRQYEVLVSLVLVGDREQALAKRLNVTQQAVNRSKQQALHRLRTSVQL